MSRKILFRAWDVKYKVMLDGFAIYWQGDHIGMSWSESGAYYNEAEVEEDTNHFSQGDDWLYILNDFKLMQFTGLTDKNGREIYEGDLLTLIDTNMSEIEVKFVDGQFVGEGPFNTHPLISYFKATDFQSIEVSGNIYESPF